MALEVSEALAKARVTVYQDKELGVYLPLAKVELPDGVSGAYGTEYMTTLPYTSTPSQVTSTEDWLGGLSAGKLVQEAGTLRGNPFPQSPSEYATENSRNMIHYMGNV